jgi:hypothetical protein
MNINIIGTTSSSLEGKGEIRIEEIQDPSYAYNLRDESKRFENRSVDSLCSEEHSIELKGPRESHESNSLEPRIQPKFANGSY